MRDHIPTLDIAETAIGPIISRILHTSCLLFGIPRNGAVGCKIICQQFQIFKTTKFWLEILIYILMQLHFNTLIAEL